MTLTDQIKQKIEEKFTPDHFELINQSDQHIGHAGHDGSGESHFKLVIVSKSFDEYTRVQRSRQVYSALDGLFDKGLHALSLQLMSPQEFSNL